MRWLHGRIKNTHLSPPADRMAASTKVGTFSSNDVDYGIDGIKNIRILTGGHDFVRGSWVGGLGWKLR